MVNPSLSQVDGDDSSAVEDTPLLVEPEPQKKTRRGSAIVGNPAGGYQTIPVEVPEEDEREQHSVRKVFAILSVLLVGVFISNTDSTLVFTTVGNISSEFDDLQNGPWLLTSFGLASCVAQPLYGKLSDILGRKAVLQTAYFLFALGGAICGLGRSMGEIIVGRVIQGAGAAGMVVLVSILITDLVPLREVAAYRSYVNIVQTVGRSCGGPIGGALAQTKGIGWRGAFLIQAPLTVVAMILVAWGLQIKPKTDGSKEQSITEKLKRIDFLGAFFLSTTILSALLILDMGGDKVPWNSPVIGILSATALVSAALFYVTEKTWAQEPIFPLHLLTHRDVVLDYSLLLVQVTSQISLMLYIPLYFQITKNAQPAAAGAYMVPAVLGNTTGGLLTGIYVKRTGRYKFPIIISGISAMLCFTLLLGTWRGNTPLWQALFVFFGGFATGIAQSAVFVDLAASVEDKDIAVASAGLYLSANVGSLAGISVASAVFGGALRLQLPVVLKGIKHADKIVKKALENIQFVQELTGRVHELVVSAYVFAIRHSFTFSLCCATMTLLLGLLVREKRLEH